MNHSDYLYALKDINEKQILDEKPYNWKKHLIFQIPELFYFLFKVTVVLVFAEIVLMSMATVVADTLIQFNNQYVSEIDTNR